MVGIQQLSYGLANHVRGVVIPHRACLEPGCGQYAAPKGRGRCAFHARQRDRSINRAGKKDYGTKRWQILRRRVLYEKPICAVEDCWRIATDVDHIKPLAEGGAMWDRKNLSGLCAKHHSQKTRAEQLA